MSPEPATAPVHQEWVRARIHASASLNDFEVAGATAGCWSRQAGCRDRVIEAWLLSVANAVPAADRTDDRARGEGIAGRRRLG
jgi:hypothetical protein